MRASMLAYWTNAGSSLRTSRQQNSTLSSASSRARLLRNRSLTVGVKRKRVDRPLRPINSFPFHSYFLLFAHISQQSPRNHHPLNLVRSLEDLSYLHVAHIAFNRVVTYIACTTQDLHGISCHLHCHIGSETLGHRSIHAGVLPLVQLISCFINQETRRFNLHRHISQHKLDALKCANRLAKLLALSGVIASHLKSCLRYTYRYRSDVDSPSI